ncbi:response regulator [Isoptericola cucumis]|uniref:DNA-binding response regulator n=1 Tax=Isoptericola cucumis TaxID=1776856 RepID=A0ABQ2B568_9MICO|nr:response regulator transcription factor [Isoptericola cucumis]GGI06405.1 DNA-binding response regulator [Isoptericola cucumis]
MTGPTTGPITVLLVDDHHVVRAGLRALLDSQADIEVVGQASSGEEALGEVAALDPDLVVMDLALGDGMDGVAATRAVRAAHPQVPVLVFSAYDTDADVVRVVDAGAIGYVLKDAPPAEIFAAVRGAVVGRSVLSPPVASRLLQQAQNPGSALTPREAELLTLLAQGLSNRELGRRLFISEATVKTHLAHVYAKLGVDSRAAAVALALRGQTVR